MVMGACNPSYMEGWGLRIAWTQEVEFAVSWDCANALHSEWEWDSISEKKKKASDLGQAQWLTPMIPEI